MAKTAPSIPSADSSKGQRQHQQQQQQQSQTTVSSKVAKSVATTSSATHKEVLPQCKVKRNYACTKCAYYTQNPRSFLHHQKNVHSEQLRVYECPHCLYASRHSQKLHRHVQMVHDPNYKKTHGYKNHQGNAEDGTKSLLVPPVRIRVPRYDNPYDDQKISELVIVEDVDMNDDEQQPEFDEEDGVEEENGVEEEEFSEGVAEEDQEMAEEEMTESDQEGEDDEEDEQDDAEVYGNDDAHADQDELSVTIVSPPTPPQSQPKKQNKNDKQPSVYVKCSVCSFGSHSQTLVNRHEKTAHLKKKFFRCMKCNYVTHMRARYTKHVKYHTMPMIKCDDCDFSTPYKWNLDRHNRNHSTDNPGTYKCSHCSFSADIKQSLTVHETNHHVPPVGGLLSSPNRRRARVGASDAPGSAVDGTEIVTYETTKDGGIVEIMATETKSAIAKGGTADTSSSNVVIMTTTSVTTTTTSAASADTFVTPHAATLKLISAVTAEPTTSSSKDEKVPPRRRPLPRLIPIGDQQRLTITPTVMRLPSPPTEETARTPTPSRSGSPKNKIASFFDKLKAKVDETADLTCSVCRFESKCLSEFMRHQRTHNENDDEDAADDASSAATSPDQTVVINKSENIELSLQPPPPPPVTAAELKSTRCQRCRKRCKTSAELVVHLATCRGAATVTTANHVNTPATFCSVPDENDINYYHQDSVQQQQQQHPMENKIFVWNTAVLPTPHGMQDDEKQHSVTLTEITPSVEQQETQQQQQQPDDDVDEEEVEEDEDDDDDEEEMENDHSEEFYPSTVVKKQQHRQQQQLTDKQKLRLKQQQLKQQQRGTRKEGKIHKTVFKCPHCTFWAATASRFHVHIVGHLNRKPFECSCCAYRSNWRWDITKHIRLKSARRPGVDESQDSSNLHHGAKVLMTDETGRRNYSKYNGYLTVMEMDIADGVNKAAGGDFEDGKCLASQKMGGGTPKKRRTTAANKMNTYISLQETPLAKVPRIMPNRSHLLNQNIIVNTPPVSSSSSSSSPSSSTVTISDNRSKTMWKCKKCFFRDCDRLTVLNHVKAHYRRGEFDSSTGAPISSQQNLSENDMKTKNTTEPKETNDLKTPTNDRRKSKTPTTGTVDDSMLILSTNSNYDDEHFLSCPLCDLNVGTSSELKDHMERNHFSGETKYRCEYCKFWSEDKKAMLDHMRFAHEMDDGNIKNNVNTTAINGSSKQYEESNSFQDINMQEEDVDNVRAIDENYSSSDTTNLEVMFESSDDNIVVYETVECKSNFNEHDRELSKSSEKSSFNSSIGDEKINEFHEFDNTNTQDDNEQINNEQIIVREEELSEPASVNVEIIKAITKTASVSITEGQADTTTASELSVKWPVKGNTYSVYECNDCLYFSNNEKKMQAHKELHVKRGALFNCALCVFNVTNSSVLYHHYRYGHMIEEPELRYPEDVIIQIGHKDMMSKNAVEKSESKSNAADEDGPPLVWFYNKDIVPPFSKVFRCRYCPHTNRRRHNTVEHERMHSDHPEHQNHRLQQQMRSNGTTPTVTILHPCKRCTYVCSNAGVLASHMKVHSSYYGTYTVGFYDSSIEDPMQEQALEYVMELEKNWNRNIQLSILKCDERSFDISDDSDVQDDDKFIEFDEPTLKFCPYCPARFFFYSDLQCHIRFHKVRVWDHSCDCCSFTAKTAAHITTHEVVHCDEYAQRTAELLSGYPVSERYPRPSEYAASANGSCSPRWTRVSTRSLLRSPIHESIENTLPESIGQNQLLSRTTKRLRPYSESDDDNLNSQPPLEKQKYVENNQRPQRSKKSLKITTKTRKTKGVFGKVKTTNLIRQFMCEKCPAMFFKTAALMYHKTLHGGPGRHHCRRCDYAVSTYGNLVRHESVHTDLSPRKKKTESSLLESETLNSPSLISTPTPSQPVLPTSNSNDDEKNIINDSLTDESFEIDPEFGPSMLGNPKFNYPTSIKNGVSRPKRYKCYKCPSAFDKREQYAVHLTLHGANDKYQCDLCDYSVRYTANYIQHKRKHARDDEIRKIIEQASVKAKIVDDQEKGANSLQGYHKPISNNVFVSEKFDSPVKVERESSFEEEPEYLVKDEPQCPIKEELDSPVGENLDYSIKDEVEYSIKEEMEFVENAELDVVEKKDSMTAKTVLPILPKKTLLTPPTLAKWEPRKIIAPSLVKLDPRNTVFRNEISDRQTAYELNAAYGSTGIVADDIIGEPLTLFRCNMCPFEGEDHDQLDQHKLHHTENLSSDASVSTSKVSTRPWKFACRFCSYRTQLDVDLTDHIRVHFLRSTGSVLSSYAASSSLPKGNNIESMDPTDHIEFHGKRIVYNNRRRGKIANNALTASPDSSKNTNVANKAEEEPFFVFKDKGSKYGNGTPDSNGKTIRFSPDYQSPPILIDYNDNRTCSAGNADKLQQKSVAYVQLVDRGKKLEVRGNEVDSPNRKRKRGKK